RIYASSDVFVFPSRTDTFGNVLLEAMASGCPVAAFNVTGPIDVVGSGGALSEDLGQAALDALDVPRKAARARALACGWREWTRQCLCRLRPVRAQSAPERETAPDVLSS